MLIGCFVHSYMLFFWDCIAPMWTQGNIHLFKKNTKNVTCASIPTLKLHFNFRSEAQHMLNADIYLQWKLYVRIRVVCMMNMTSKNEAFTFPRYKISITKSLTAKIIDSLGKKREKASLICSSSNCVVYVGTLWILNLGRQVVIMLQVVFCYLSAPKPIFS